MKKKGNILTENIIFLVLTLVVISILLMYTVTQSSHAGEIEEIYAKQVALMLDGVKPNSIIYLKADKILDKAEDLYKENPFIIENNKVIVKIVSGGGYSYSFFNNGIIVSNIYLSTSGEHEGEYVFIIEPSVAEEVKNE